MKNKFSMAMSLAVMMAMLVTSLALADVVTSDVVATTGNQTFVDLGNVSPGQVITSATSFQLVCNGNNHADQDNTVNVQFSSVSPAGNLTATNTTIGPIPSSWADDTTGNSNCPSPAPVLNDNGDSAVTITAPTTAGTYNFVVTYKVATSGGIDPNDVTGSIPAVTFRITVVSDTTAPVITPNISGTLGNNGWYTSNVSVSWTVEDGESTISSISGCGTTNISVDTTASGTTLTCSATSVGGTTTQSVTIKRDASAPSIIASANPPANTNGWNNSDVTVSYSCTDNGPSGVDIAASDYGDDVLNGSGSASGTCVDLAGNSANASYDAQIDKVKPVITGSRTPAANANGWNNTDVSVSFSCTDSGGSGIGTNTVADATVSTEGANPSVTNTGTCTDRAGNTADSATVSGINIDKTPPIASASASPAANANGWNNTNVTVSFSGNDGTGSGIDSCDPAVLLSSEGANQSGSGSCTDKAGNVSDLATASDINIDKTAPTITAQRDTAANANGWNKTDVASSYNASDTLSGLASPASGDFTFTSEGADQEHTFTVTDLAGNSASATVSGVSIDKTAPSLSGTATTAPNANGWYKGDVIVAWTCSDALSGLDGLCPANSTITGEGSALSASTSVTDLAGNSASATVGGIKIDRTKPTISAAATTAPNGAGWYNSNVTVTFTCEDDRSGILSGVCPANQTLSAEGTTISSTAQTVNDAAGNTSDPSNVVTVKIDKTAPSVSVIGVTNGATYTLGSVPAAGCSTSDALSGVETSASLSLSGGPVGSITATCGAAADKAGNPGSASVTYSVVYNWSGFFQPIDNNGVFNSAKAGSTIPVKFSLGGDQGLGILATGYPKITQVACTATAQVDAIEELTTSTNSGLRYDPLANQYIYNWKTQSTYATKCYQLSVKLIDGTEHTALFKFLK